MVQGPLVGQPTYPPKEKVQLIIKDLFPRRDSKHTPVLQIRRYDEKDHNSDYKGLSGDRRGRGSV